MREARSILAADAAGKASVATVAISGERFCRIIDMTGTHLATHVRGFVHGASIDGGGKVVELRSPLGGLKNMKAEAQAAEHPGAV